MRLERNRTGRICPSDPGIRFVRVRGTVRADRTRGDGWEVQVRRPPGRRVLRHVARNLKEATRWAREHWRPDFLEALVSGLPAQHPAHQLHREAVLGDPLAFLALLDAAEEAGLTVARASLTGRARWECLFLEALPETPDERRAAEAIYVSTAGWLASIAHEKWFADRRGFYDGGPADRSFAYYDNHPFACDPNLRPRMLEAALARLRLEGIGTLAEASYPESGDGEGYTVVILFDAPTEDQRMRVMEVLDDAFREALRSPVAG